MSFRQDLARKKIKIPDFFLSDSERMQQQLELPYLNPVEERSLPKWGFWTLNTRVDKRRLAQRTYTVEKIGFVLTHIRRDVDSYMSQCFFSKPNRRALNVAYVTHAYVDLDTYNAEWLVGRPVDEMVNIIRMFCSDEAIPEPSYIISSGRGIYLKWAWTHPLPRAAVGRCVAVNRELVRRFQSFGADPKAVDMSRILRVIGTTNTKSGKIVEIVYLNDVSGTVVGYDFDLFADELLPYSMAQIRSFRDQATAAPVAILSHERQKRRTGTVVAWEQWHWGVLEDLRNLMDLRGWGVVPEGHRDLFGHIGACQLAQVFPAHTLWHEVLAWARLILPHGYVETELRGHASSLLDRAKRAASGEKVEFAGKLRSPIYTYRKSTMIDLLQIVPAEMEALGFLIDKREKYRRSNERRRKTRHDRAEYEARSLSATKPWENLGMSRASWYRAGKHLE